MDERAETLCDEKPVLPLDPTELTHQNASVNVSTDSSQQRDDKKQEFTSEIFKIELKQLPRFFGFGELKKKLRQLQLDYVKIKSPSGNRGGYAYVTFRSEEARQRALVVLNGAKFKGSVLKAVPAKAVEDPLVKIRQENAKMAVPNDEPADVRDAVTPWWTMTYEEQLDKKQANVREWLEKLARKMSAVNPQLNRWINEQKEKNSQLCCPLEDIVASPVVDGYRNKCEFAIGTSASSVPLTVGFRLGRYSGGSTAVASPDQCSHIPPAMLTVVHLFEQWVRQPDVNLSSFDPETRGGHWKQLMVRVTTTGAVMIAPRLHPQQLTQEAILNVKMSLKQYFEQIMTTAPFCTEFSLFFAVDDSR